ncbi:hypothetical protein [Siccirubricoccus sp. G192]|uniref:hypothetical protein n=1 Tax=Siccirubricoccus sp. G192 TaxID=2849651 RepID=UPI001C2BEDC5|nr:hypothetical protein [Siccirubricoccus sp. G192]MBV1800477.1 hypothetical protein [Siccirubricoccus sp. G192]
MEEIAARRRDADRARMLKPLDQPQHGGWLGSPRYLPQPGQSSQVVLLPAYGQGIEAPALFGGEAVGQPPIGFLARAVAEFSAFLADVLEGAGSAGSS